MNTDSQKIRVMLDPRAKITYADLIVRIDINRSFDNEQGVAKLLLAQQYDDILHTDTLVLPIVTLAQLREQLNTGEISTLLDQATKSNANADTP